MDGDDLSGLLPEPPPPRPARRDAAIAAAMRRFDGIADPPIAGEPASAPKPPRKARWVPLGAVASIVAVALISIPIAVRMPSGPSPQPRPDSSAEQAANMDVRPSAEPVAPSPMPEAARLAGPPAEMPKPSAAPAPTGGTTEPDRELARREAPAFWLEPPPPSTGAPPADTQAAALPSARAPLAASPVVVTGSRVARASPQPAAPAAVAGKAETADERREVVVTGAALARPRAASRRGDWNACTVNDPQQSLRGCGQLVNPAAKGLSGAAAAHLADGLALGWRADWQSAIDAFDRAIALKPKLAFAYLNRGLAYQHRGDLTRAMADLDLAVRYAPSAARGYYNRSIVRQRSGDSRGAREDATRAADLDSRYEAVLDDR